MRFAFRVPRAAFAFGADAAARIPTALCTATEAVALAVLQRATRNAQRATW